MAEEQIGTELFVGREQELEQFKRFLEPESTTNILNIYGEAGIGKTQLLLQMKKYCAPITDKVVVSKEVIDFYDIESRSRLGILRQIVEYLGISQEIESEEIFWEEYGGFAEKMEHEKKLIVLFFDSYEYIQSIQAKWVEKQLFPQILKNTRIIISGRNRLQEVNRSGLEVKKIEVSHFNLDDTISFLKRCFNITTNRKLEEKIGLDIVKSLHFAVSSSPVLLALLTDKVIWSRNSFSPEDLFNIIPKTVPPFTKAFRQAFEIKLIKPITEIAKSEARAIAYMAIAYRRMTPEMFHVLTLVPINKCREIFKKLQPFPIIKNKKKGILLLHDEIRHLVVQYFWDNQDTGWDQRKEIAKAIQAYYDEHFLADSDISELEREIYSSEALEYAFLANSQDGLKLFCQKFDLAMANEKYNHAYLLLLEAENYHSENKPKTIFDFLEISRKRICYEVETNENYGKSLQKTNVILEKYGNLICEYFQKPEKVSGEASTLIRILHLSDLHFKAEDNVVTKLYPLIADLRDKEEGLGFDTLDYLVLSGDITEQATQEEFELAKDFILGIMKEFHLEAQNCIIVPGNHDLSWEEDVYIWKQKRKIKTENLDLEQYCEQGDGILIRDETRYPNRFENFSKFLYYPLFQRPYPLEFKKQCMQYLFKDPGIQFITINSSWKIDEWFQDRSDVHEEALAQGLMDADKELTQQLESSISLLRIAVLHHPVAGKEMIKDDGFVEQLRRANVPLILHGHVHEDRREVVGYVHRQVHVVGAGSFGAPAKDRAEFTPRLYNALEIQRDYSSIRVHTRCLIKETGAWRGWPEWQSPDDPKKWLTHYNINLNPSSESEV